MATKNTKQWIRVFFVIAIISLSGIIWQWQKKTTTIVKVEGGSFTEGIIGTPRFINPVLAQSQSDKDLTQLIFGSMISKDTEGQNVFYLAESLTVSDDRKTYTLKLKDDLYFHDGQAITIDDVIFTIEKIQDPSIKSPLQNKWDGISIEKEDSLTARFILLQEYSDFENNLSLGILPKHIWEDIKSDEFIFSLYNSNPIGSGNYQVHQIHKEKTGIPSSYILKKTKQSDAYISEIELIFYENENELIQAYRKGSIDAAYGLSANKETRDLFDNEYGTTGKLPRIFGLFFNQNKQELLKDGDLRELIKNSIQREDIINQIFAGYAYPINNPLGNIYQEQKQDTLLLEEKIEDDGWKKNEQGIYSKSSGDTEKILSLDLSTPNTEELIELAQQIKTTLKEKGIHINIRIFDEADLHQKVIRPRDYEILLFGYMLEKETDLYAFWHSSQKNDPGLNISLYSNSVVDKELEKLRKDKSTANLTIIENEIDKDTPAVFIYSPAFTYLLPEKIKGEYISIIEKQDRYADIENWYIYTRSIWNIFLK